MLTDHRTCARNEKQKVKEKVGKLSDVKLLPVAIGRHVNLKELQKINDGQEVPMFGEYEDPEKVGTKIIQGIYCKCTPKKVCFYIAFNVFCSLLEKFERNGKSYDHRDLIVLEKLRFQNVFHPN